MIGDGAAALLERVRARGYSIRIDGADLVVGPAPVPEDLRRELRVAKSAIIELLRRASDGDTAAIVDGWAHVLAAFASAKEIPAGPPPVCAQCGATTARVYVHIAPPRGDSYALCGRCYADCSL